MKQKFSLLILLVLCISLFSGCNNTKENIEVGVMLPLTGNIAFIGENFKNGVLLAKSEQNDSTISFLFDDHQNAPKEAVNIYNKYKLKDNLKIAVATLTSVNNAILPLNKEDPKVIIGSILSGTNIVEKDSFLFRYFLSTISEVDAMLDYFNVNDVQDIGLIYVNDDFGLDAKNYFLEKYTGNVKYLESHDKNDNDFRDIASKAKDIEHLYILSYGNSYGNLIKQLREFGYSGELYAFSSFGSPVVFQQPGNYLKGVKFTGTNYYETTDNTISSFKQKYLMMFNKEPDQYSIYGYDIALIIYKAIYSLTEKEIPISTNNLQKEILSWDSFNSTYGETSINRYGDFLFKAFLFEVGNNNQIIKID